MYNRKLSKIITAILFTVLAIALTVVIEDDRLIILICSIIGGLLAVILIP